MKLFKTVDEKFKDLGWNKVKENENYYVIYEKYNKQFKYTHAIEICHKANGLHIVQSYQKDSPIKDFDYMIGLPVKEMKLCIKKMKKLGWI